MLRQTYCYLFVEFFSRNFIKRNDKEKKSKGKTKGDKEKKLLILLTNTKIYIFTHLKCRKRSMIFMVLWLLNVKMLEDEKC